MKKRGGKATSYSGSMVEPTNSYAREQWLNQTPPQKSKNWFLPAAIGTFVLIAIIIAVIAILPAKEGPTEESAEIPEPTISDEEDLGAYFNELVSDPDYEPEFSDTSSRYLVPPTNISCKDFKKVSRMNADILNLYLDSGYVVSIRERESAILVYYGVYDEYSYRTIPIDCSSSIDTSIAFSTYDADELFGNYSSDTKYYVWIDPKTLNQDGGGY